MALMSRYIKRRNKGGALICKDQNYRRGAYSTSGAEWIIYGKVDQDNEITKPQQSSKLLVRGIFNSDERLLQNDVVNLFSKINFIKDENEITLLQKKQPPPKKDQDNTFRILI